MALNFSDEFAQRASKLFPSVFSWNEALVIASLLATSFIFIHHRSQRPSLSAGPKLNGEPRNADGRKQERRGLGDVRLTKILVHPIKSCRGTSVQSAKFTAEGIENDRKWCFIDATTHKVLTARELPTMVLIYPTIEEDDTDPHGGRLVITIPAANSGEFEPITLTVPLRPTEDVLSTWAIVDDIVLWSHTGIDGYIVQCLPSTSASVPTPNPSEVLSRFFSREVRLVYKGPRPRICFPTDAFPKLEASVVYQDSYPLLVMGQENMDELNVWIQEMITEGKATGRELIGEEWRNGIVTVERFRPNLVFTGAGAYAEDHWEEIAIGHTKEEAQDPDTPGISLVAKCQRCLLPNVSPETGIRDKAVPFKVMMKHRIGVDPLAKLKPCMGVNGAPKGSGVYKVGDWVDVRRFVGDNI
ncbi:hypothetical protein PC9H_003082 [Pleurotus ostreatus]|uniref:MOSC domain-containing protein n=1 Tax=Pleurotus ostreatus TaxID=5322 RepID=A0A8H7DW52_PLEOS|nr:uncharacterized protein PC9H_003082 [Pleurotus ostreatus]KAF7436253.1 hypothetical protein PC9H_003082 [Pleurotus ostreatus]